MCLTELSAAAISVAAALSSRIGSAPAVLVMAAKPWPRFVTCPGHVLRHRSSLLPSGILRRSFCSRYDVPAGGRERRSEEHTSELQSRRDLVCRLLLEIQK